MTAFIDVVHPETGGFARVAESAFKHMKAKGWERAPEPGAQVEVVELTPPPAPVEPVERPAKTPAKKPDKPDRRPEALRRVGSYPVPSWTVDDEATEEV